MKFKNGDVVLVGNGEVHWEVVGAIDTQVTLRSPMSGRRRLANVSELKPWTPGA